MSLAYAMRQPTLRRRFSWSWFAEYPLSSGKLTVNAVTLAKSRILKRLREEAGDLLK